MKGLTSYALSLGLILSAGWPTHAQESQEQIPRLRVVNYAVVVDAVVTDKRNRHLTDLTIDDFEIWEDGELQQIDTVRLDAAAESVQGDDDRPATASETQTIAVDTEPRPHLIVLLMDYATVQFTNQRYVREAAVDYVRNHLRPGDLMAVFQVGMSLQFLQGFTNDRELLLRALDHSSPTGSLYAADQSQLVNSAETTEDMVEILTTSLDAIASSPNRGAGPNGLLVQLLNNQLERAQAAEGTFRAQLSYSREQQSRPVIGAVRTIADGVAHIPGRKSLILVSEGFSVPLTLEKPFLRAVEKAVRSNLAIYAIDGSGLAVKARGIESELYDISAARSGDRVKAYGGLSQFDRAREIGSDQKDSSLRYLASQTGGLLIRHTNDFKRAFDRVNRDLRSRYLLTYTPRNLDFKGEFRKLEVNVKRKGARVRARSGYWAVPSGASVLSAEEFKLLIDEDWSLKNRPDEFPVAFQPSYFLIDDNQYQVFLTLEIPTGSFERQSQGDREFTHLHLVGLVQDAWGNVVGSFRGPSRVALPADVEYLRLDSQMGLAPGAYSLSVYAADPLSGRSGFLQRTLRLPAVEQKTVLSSLVLGETVVRSNGDRSYFSAGDVTVFPSARRKFRDGDRLVYLFNVQRPGLSDDDSARLDLKVSLERQGRNLHTFTDSLQLDNLSSEAIASIPFARTLKLEGLPPGRYMLRAEVYDHVRSQRVQTQTAFEIER